MKAPRNLRSGLATGALVALVVLGWLFIAPRPVGGPVSYVVTEGISMRPRLTAGDLVVVRETEDYKVGDVVAFESPNLGVVLHRIIGVDGDHYIFKGDNNDFVDQDRPTKEDLLGKEWFVVPGAGHALGWVGKPLNAALMAGAVALLMLGGLGVKRTTVKKDAPRRRGASLPTFATGSTATILIAGGVLAAMAVGAALLFALPERESSDRPVSYTHLGTYSYSAPATESAVYPDGRVGTGEPIFLNLVDQLDVRFDYGFRAPGSHAVGGAAALSAEITDSNGWSRSFVLDKASEFRGNRASLRGSLDLAQLRKLVAKIQRLTGVQEPFYTISLTPSIKVKGEVNASTFNDEFAPSLSFELDNLRMRLVQPPVDPLTQRAVNVLEPSEEGTVEVASERAKRIGVGPLSVSVGSARWSLLVGAGLAALALVFALMFQSSPGQPEIEAILRHLSGRVVNVSSISATAARNAIEMSTIDDLMEVADRYGRVILHDYHDHIHSFVVEEDGIAYWFQILGANGVAVEAANVARLDDQRPASSVAANATLIPREKSR